MRLSENPVEVVDGVLKGLTVLFQSKFIDNLRLTILKNPTVDVENAVNRNQMQSKTWIVEELQKVKPDLGVMYILGGWFGILPALLLDNKDFQVKEIHSFDIDKGCEPIAEQINRHHVEAKRFKAWTDDAYKMKYRGHGERPDAEVVVNTVCEHLPDLQGWMDVIPKGTFLILQSNNYFSEPDHINCVHSLEEFEQQMKLSKVVFRGSKDTKKYTRFMLMGYK